MTEDTDKSFIDKLEQGDEEGFKDMARAHVVDAVAKQVGDVGDDDINVKSSEEEDDTSSSEEETDNASGDSSEEKDDGEGKDTTSGEKDDDAEDK